MGELGRFQTNIVEASGTVGRGHILREALASQPGPLLAKGEKNGGFFWFSPKKSTGCTRKKPVFVWEILVFFTEKLEYVK